MAKWHVNPSTGIAGKCSAEYSCPFGGALGGHEDTKKAASKLYEDYRDGLYSTDHASYFYFISDEENEMFTGGDCGLLARELNKKTGDPVHAVGIRSKDTGEVEWQHMTVKTSEGRFLDVTGIQPEANLIKAWTSHIELQPDEELVIEEIDEKEIESRLGKDPGKKSFERSDPSATASKVLKALAEKF